MTPRVPCRPPEPPTTQDGPPLPPGPPCRLRRHWLALAAPLGLGLLLPGWAAAHGAATHPGARPAPPPEQTDWGIAGRRAQARTVHVRMSDAMRFTPDRLRVKQGETLRLVIHNDGRMLHEFVIGTGPVLDEHAALMQKFPDMEHDQPYMAHVPPGRTGEIVWTFNRAGAFKFACLIAGHYTAGMFGDIIVETP